MSDVVQRINEYLGNGGLFNPEMMDHEKVRDLLLDCREHITRFEASIHAACGLLKPLGNQPIPSVLAIREAVAILHSPLADRRNLINKHMLQTLEWIASQKNLFFSECSQAEEILERCRISIEQAKQNE